MGGRQLRPPSAVGAVLGGELMAGDWLAERRTEVAADRILDAAGELFASQAAASVGMHEIASAAGCSRATLYRYFENREALYTAYVHRESYRLYREMAEHTMSIDDPRERLIEGMLASLRNVRESPALSSWFATAQRPIGAEMAEQSEVIKALTEAFVISLGPDDAGTGASEATGNGTGASEATGNGTGASEATGNGSVAHRARWLVRVMTSLMLFPGHDADDERTMLEEFVVPIVLPKRRADQATQ